LDKHITQPLVSIVMPAYNAVRYIQEAIDSVIDQTYTNWELIIIDDGSTDHTAQIIRSNCLLDSRIKILQQKNGKQGSARNKGIKYANGEYIAFLDADDLWLADKLRVQVDNIQQSVFDLIFSDTFLFENDNHVDVSNKFNALTGILNGHESVEILLQANRIPILTVLVKKSSINKSGLFTEDENIQCVEDYHLWLKMLNDGCIFFGYDYPLAKYRMHQLSATSSDRSLLDKMPYMINDLIVLYPNKIFLFKEKVSTIYYIQCFSSIQNIDSFSLSLKKYLNIKEKYFFFMPIILIKMIFGIKIARKITSLLVSY